MQYIDISFANIRELFQCFIIVKSVINSSPIVLKKEKKINQATNKGKKSLTDFLTFISFSLLYR